eukprot:scaffold48315_cov64-Phaeocystis_antarctica.AAC.4
MYSVKPYDAQSSEHPLDPLSSLRALLKPCAWHSAFASRMVGAAVRVGRPLPQPCSCRTPPSTSPSKARASDQSSAGERVAISRSESRWLLEPRRLLLPREASAANTARISSSRSSCTVSHTGLRVALKVACSCDGPTWHSGQGQGESCAGRTSSSSYLRCFTASARCSMVPRSVRYAVVPLRPGALEAELAPRKYSCAICSAVFALAARPDPLPDAALVDALPEALLAGGSASESASAGSAAGAAAGLDARFLGLGASSPSSSAALSSGERKRCCVRARLPRPSAFKRSSASCAAAARCAAVAAATASARACTSRGLAPSCTRCTAAFFLPPPAFAGLLLAPPPLLPPPAPPLVSALPPLLFTKTRAELPSSLEIRAEPAAPSTCGGKPTRSSCRLAGMASSEEAMRWRKSSSVAPSSKDSVMAGPGPCTRTEVGIWTCVKGPCSVCSVRSRDEDFCRS